MSRYSTIFSEDVFCPKCERHSFIIFQYNKELSAENHRGCQCTICSHKWKEEMIKDGEKITWKRLEA